MTALVLAAAAAAAGTCLSAAAPQSLDDVLERASAYVAAYERDLGSIIAEEQYRQDVAFPAASDPVTGIFQRLGNPIRRRTLRSEFLLLRPAGRGELRIGFRDVLDVDGRSAPDRTNVRERLAARSEVGDDDLRRLLSESARFNIGSLTRNVNVPTFALLVVHAEVQGRFSFEKRDERRFAGTRSVALAFQERVRPTIIRSPDGADLPAAGTVWVDPATGRVIQTQLITEQPEQHVRAEITVRYRPDEKLGLWVPVEMTEQYHVGRPNSFTEQNIHCVARYSNFRRFEVEVRLRVPNA
jgi:hypothetical protein